MAKGSFLLFLDFLHFGHDSRLKYLFLVIAAKHFCTNWNTRLCLWYIRCHWFHFRELTHVFLSLHSTLSWIYVFLPQNHLSFFHLLNHRNSFASIFFLQQMALQPSFFWESRIDRGGHWVLGVRPVRVQAYQCLSSLQGTEAYGESTKQRYNKSVVSYWILRFLVDQVANKPFESRLELFRVLFRDSNLFFSGGLAHIWYFIINWDIHSKYIN